jgi:hypothetical protein
MPVARIFTSHPDRTESLSRQLQSQGYTVEVLSPNAAVSRPAELEIDFEIWPEDSVLERAAELAEELHADVAVEPGVGLSSHEAAPQAAPSTLVHEDRLPDEPQPQPIAQSPAPKLPVALHPQEGAPGQAPTLNATAEPRLAPQHPANELPPEPAYLETEQRDAVNAQRVSAMEDQDSIPARAGLAGELWTTASQTLKQAAERSRIFLAESNVRREQKLLELTERKAQAQERANELHAARQAASARLQELVRMGGTEPLPASPYHLDETEAEEVQGSRSGSAFAQARDRVNEWWRMLLGRRYSPQVQAILTGVAAIMALFVLAMAIASLRPRPALSNSLDTNYKGVTVKTGGATVTPAPAKSPATRPSPVVVRNAPNTGKQSPAHRDGNAVPQSDSGDVTVRRLKGQAPAPKPAAKNTPQSSMKRITDLDN